MACTPSWNRGGCTPILQVEDQGNCGGPAGGTKTVGVPTFTPIVDNVGSLVWTDENYTVIESDEDGTPYWFDNI